MRWAGYTAGMEKTGNGHTILVGENKERYQLGYLGVCGRLILKWFLIEWGDVDWIHPAQDMVHLHGLHKRWGIY